MPVYHHDIIDEARKLLTPYVEDGAMYLDRVHRGWFHSIDSSMRMQHTMKRADGRGGDVLIQLSGIDQPLATLTVMSEAMVKDGQYTRLGFAIPDAVYDELLPMVQKFNLVTSKTDHVERIDAIAAAYEILTDLWQEEVESRVECD